MNLITKLRGSTFCIDIIRYYPGRKTPKIKAPVLFCICETDTVAPAKATLRHAKRTPHKEIKPIHTVIFTFTQVKPLNMW